MVFQPLVDSPGRIVNFECKLVPFKVLVVVEVGHPVVDGSFKVILILLSQWLIFDYFFSFLVITYLVGKIDLELLFHGPLAK